MYGRNRYMTDPVILEQIQEKHREIVKRFLQKRRDVRLAQALIERKLIHDKIREDAQLSELEALKRADILKRNEYLSLSNKYMADVVRREKKKTTTTKEQRPFTKSTVAEAVMMTNSEQQQPIDKTIYQNK